MSDATGKIRKSSFWSHHEGVDRILKPGDTITVTATEVAVYGIHCVTESSQPALLLIPYISWIPCFCSCEQFADPGDVIDAAVRFVDPESGNIALTHCEMFADPWESKRLSLGARYEATAIRHVESADRCGDNAALLIRLMPGTFAMLCGDHADVEIGEVISVSISEMDERRRSVTVSRC